MNMQLKSTRQIVSKHQRHTTTVQLSNLVAMEDPFSVLSEVTKIISALDPGFDTQILEKVFRDIVKLFSGGYPGYRKCNTLYHDLKHTTDTLLAMARLIHGAHIGGLSLQKCDLLVQLIYEIFIIRLRGRAFRLF
jgi:hypothetical protein